MTQFVKNAEPGGFRTGLRPLYASYYLRISLKIKRFPGL
jgi:hypothetical protein